MRKQIFILFFSVLGCIVCLTVFSPDSMAQSVQVNASVPDLLLNGDPSGIKIGDHLGEKIDVCIEKRVKDQDVNHLIIPFYNKTETRRWQSEFWGKWMLGAVLSYRYTHDPVLMDSIQKGVKDLLGSQLPNGYIGNYSEEAQLQQWDVWGRKYSMLGLLSYYDLTGDKKVLKACQRIADHLMTQVGPGKTNIVTTGNYMGMASSSILEPIVFLYRRTGDTRYLDFAKYIVAQWETPEGPRLISKAEAGIPVANRFPHPITIQQAWFGTHNGQKAYEMMSCYEGLLELYKLTNDPQYLSAVEKTVQSIIDTEINIAGSGSAFECWYHGKPQQTRPTYHTMETCVTMTWMKLCQTLLCLTGNPIYADQMEITTYNALLASMKDDGSQIAKYSPLEGQRHPGEEQCGMHINCCNANGPRAFALLPQFAVMQSAGNNEVYINLYTDFTATVPLTPKKKVVIKQESNYPTDGKIHLQVDTDKPETFTVALRIPSWSNNNSVAVNGEILEGVNPGTYYKVNRNWKKGDIITLDLDVRGRMVKQDGYAAVIKGPVVLARDSRFGDGFIDETAQIVHKDNYVELTPSLHTPKGLWMSYTAPLVLGTDLEGDARNPKQIHFCDFASAGNTWLNDVRYRVWITETLNVRNEPYESYNVEKEKPATVGVYYFDGWSGKNRYADDPAHPWAKNAPTHLTKRFVEEFPEREPVWGWRNDSLEIMERQIDLAADNGVEFFLFCWYWKDNKGPINIEAIEKDHHHKSLELFMKAKNRNRIKYSLLIANHGGFEILGKENWEAAVKYWSKYFKDPQYMTVDGKPLLVVFGSGDEAIDNESLEGMQAAAKAEGLKKGLSIAGCGEPARKKSGFTHSTHYNVTSGYADGSEEHSFQELIDRAKPRWKGTEEQPYIPTINSGWDKRPWEGPDGLNNQKEGWYFPDSSPEMFKSFLTDAIQWMDDNPTKTTKERIVLVYAWNELGEGGYLVPTKGDPEAAKLKTIKAVVSGK